ncbi:MAG: malectin domain-containing carbohydrate-binding protein [Bacteroidota bacterium]
MKRLNIEGITLYFSVLCFVIMVFALSCSETEIPIVNDGDGMEATDNPVEAEDPPMDEPPIDEPPMDDPPMDDPPDSAPSVLRLNSGGPEVIFDDIIFLADDYFENSGTIYSNTGISDILETENDAIFYTERSTDSDQGTFEYKIPITNGTYTIDLHFAEIFFGAPNGGAGGVGQRVFDVVIEGQTVLMNYDIIEEVGTVTAVTKTFEINVFDELLHLEFSAGINRPKLSALEIYGNGELLPKPSNPCEWNGLASSMLEKVESQSAVVNGKLYVFAGFLANLKITAATEIYDPVLDIWSNAAPMPTPVTHMGAVTVGDEVWIVAGFAGNHPGVATDRVQIYNTLNNTWSDGPPLPQPRGSGAAAYANGKIHFFGGLLPDRVTDVGDHYVLDLANLANGWESAAPMPDPRNHLSAATINGKVYAIGGQFGHDNGVSDQDFLDVYDPNTDLWERLANLPSKRSHFEPGTFVHNNKIIIAGGRRGNSFFFDDITSYDPQYDTWSELCKLPTKLLAPVAKIINGRLIVANGGENGTCCPLNAVQWIPLDP